MREHHELVFISQNGMVQRTSVRGISKQGRPSQGVRVMNLREDDQVSAVALVMETNTPAKAVELGELEEAGGEDISVIGPTATAEMEPGEDDIESDDDIDLDDEDLDLDDDEDLDEDDDEDLDLDEDE